MNFNRCFAVIGAVLICSGSCSICKISPKVIYSTFGSTVNLTCNLTVDRMYVTWFGPPNFTLYAQGNDLEDIYKPNIRINGDATENQHILQIVKMRENNEGVYKCLATAGEHCFQLSIQRPPKNIRIKGSNSNNVIYGIVNRNMRLTCAVETGNPPESMRWEYGHEAIANGGPEMITHILKLNITYHLKTFRCIVCNNVTKTTLAKEVSIYLYSKPTANIIPGGSINITEDKTLLLECNYTSNDKSNTSITWSYTSNDRIEIIKEVLEIKKVKRIDSGKYTCKVYNSAGTATDTVNVNVLYSPAVNITLQKQQHAILLKCNAHGNPGDYLFSAWEHITEYGDHIRFLGDSGRGCITLQHSSGETDRHQDQGIYTCSVSNGVLYHGNKNRVANYRFKPKGLPYFATSSNKIQYGILGKETNLTLNVISYPKITSVSVYRNQSMVMADVKIEKELSKIIDIIYGQKVNVKGYKLFVPIVIAAPVDFMTYTICVLNENGQRNISIEIKSARKPLEVLSSYTAIYVTLPLLIILMIACGSLVYHYKKETFIRNVDISCFQWTHGRNAVGGQGMENGIYDMQNNVAPVPDAQSSDPPVYSSIDRKHNLSIGQTVSYSVAKKKKPNPLGDRHRNKGKQHVETETDIEMSNSETGENLQLNYVDVCFDPKPVGHQFKIHGMDKKSEYVDIDFSKSINILPDSEKIDGSDEDFSSVEDVIAMKRDMII